MSSQADFRVRADCLVVGAGIAGLTAAVHLSRLGHRLVVADTAGGQAQPFTGTAALRRTRLLEELLCRADGIVPAQVTRMWWNAQESAFFADVAGRVVLARTVLLATGADDGDVGLPGTDRLRRLGLLRPAGADGLSSAAGPVGMLCEGASGVESLIALHRSGVEAWLLDVGEEPSLTRRATWPLQLLGIPILQQPAASVSAADEGGVMLRLRDGTEHRFGMLANALPPRPRSRLADVLGARVHQGAIQVDPMGRSTLPGVFAAGSVTGALALDEAAQRATVAAIAIHQLLAGRQPVR